MDNIGSVTKILWNLLRLDLLSNNSTPLSFHLFNVTYHHSFHTYFIFVYVSSFHEHKFVYWFLTHPLHIWKVRVYFQTFLYHTIPHTFIMLSILVTCDFYLLWFSQFLFKYILYIICFNSFLFSGLKPLLSGVSRSKVKMVQTNEGKYLLSFGNYLKTKRLLFTTSKVLNATVYTN